MIQINSIRGIQLTSRPIYLLCHGWIFISKEKIDIKIGDIKLYCRPSAVALIIENITISSSRSIINLINNKEEKIKKYISSFESTIYAHI